ncbi:MAG TPA: BadF/BadG/BcrA/BcrD ATPase family protein [Pyrinomonadaceae bacterium]|nr:BadF/BadG/BcrA/BcrD ATPase family protein [Pyrinomonadaceae bacterium]
MKSKKNSHNLYLGVDGGGTKTHAVLIDEDKIILGEGVTGAGNPLRVGVENAIKNIFASIEKACDSADRSKGDIVSAQLGLAGVRREDLRYLIRNRFREILRIRKVEVTTDAEIALYAATEGKEGLVIIAGTGSVCMGRNAKGEMASAGGWGPLAGDEGGGAGIARRALQTIAKSSDGRGKPTKLSDYAVDYFRAGRLEDLSVAIYAPQVDNARIAGFAQYVSQAANEGDEVAQELLTEAGQELGLAATAVIQKLKLQRRKFPIGKVGSVFKSEELITKPLMEKVQSIAPKAFMSETQKSPGYAAALMAFQIYTKN